jgi:prepilin-type N-terminal cleavage/methylation domain-containing protein
MKTAQKGFTLVEIAIVLVIIGLLLGGILKGQEMIVQARIKNVIADVTGVSAALFGYQDRYRAVPGDDVNANPRWGAAVAGNGNGVVAGTYNAACPVTPVAGTTPESCLFWHHLRLAGFVAGNGTTQPFNALNGLIGVQTGDGVGGAVLPSTVPVVSPGFTGMLICTSNLPDKIAIAVDTQMDDGDVRIGSMRGQLNTGTNPAIAATGETANFVENGTNAYTLCRAL